MAAYRHLLPSMPPTNRVYAGDPNEHLSNTGLGLAYSNIPNQSVLVGQQQQHQQLTSSANVGMMTTSQSQQQQQQHLLQQQYHHPQHIHPHHLHHHQQQAQHHHNNNHLSYHHQQFNVGGQHVSLARHLLANGQHQQVQVMHNGSVVTGTGSAGGVGGSGSGPLKGMMYHNGIRSSVIPLNASK